MTLHRSLTRLVVLGLMLASATADARSTAYVQFMGAYGEDYGTATLTQTPKGVQIHAVLKGLPPGEAVLRIHTVGACSPPFSSAGEALEAAGELPKVNIEPSGEASVEILNNRVTLERGSANSLIDGRGTALIVHVRRGSNTTMRMACGVIRP
jgi:superoxide dismutase, Cu-Zn family